MLALFFCHLFAAGLYGLGLLAYELYRESQHGWKLSLRRVAAFVAVGLPFLIVRPLL